MAQAGQLSQESGLFWSMAFTSGVWIWLSPGLTSMYSPTRLPAYITSPPERLPPSPRKTKTTPFLPVTTSSPEGERQEGLLQKATPSPAPTQTATATEQLRGGCARGCREHPMDPHCGLHGDTELQPPHSLAAHWAHHSTCGLAAGIQEPR